MTRPIAQDFANLFAARHLVRNEALAVQADYGRSHSARWVSNFDAERPATMSYDNDMRIFTPSVVHDCREIFYLHVGGLVHYSTAVFASFLSNLSETTDRIIRAFDYPKAPETPVVKIVEHLTQKLGMALENSNQRHDIVFAVIVP